MRFSRQSPDQHPLRPLFFGLLLQCLVLHSSVPALEQVGCVGDPQSSHRPLARPARPAQGKSRPGGKATTCRHLGQRLRAVTLAGDEMAPGILRLRQAASGKAPCPALPSGAPEQAAGPPKAPCALAGVRAVWEQKGGVRTKGLRCTLPSATWSEPVAPAGCAAGWGSPGGALHGCSPTPPTVLGKVCSCALLLFCSELSCEPLNWNPSGRPLSLPPPAAALPRCPRGRGEGEEGGGGLPSQAAPSSQMPGGAGPEGKWHAGNGQHLW